MFLRGSICVAVLLAAGCARPLETGYQPDRLGMSESERRALYADPFSPEAAAAPNRDRQGQRLQRPHHRGPGY